MSTQKYEDEKDDVVHLEAVTTNDEERGVKKSTANTQLDDAARILQEAGGIVDATPEERKRVLRRIDLFVCA
jgi:hypothetical protein